MLRAAIVATRSSFSAPTPTSSSRAPMLASIALTGSLAPPVPHARAAPAQARRLSYPARPAAPLAAGLAGGGGSSSFAGSPLVGASAWGGFFRPTALRSETRRVYSSALPDRNPAPWAKEYDDLTSVDMLDFINKSWTAFHATREAREMLLAAGYTQLNERDEWEIVPGGKYFFTRNMSAIVAFAVGGQYKPGNGFNIVAAHTDSPCIKLKPNSAVTKGGFLGVGVQTYGGGLWHTWFDRDLSVAGRVLLRKKGGERLSHELVQVDRPILRVPTLAIHLDRTVNTDGFKPNTETHLAPVLATAIHAELSGAGKDSSDGAGSSAHHALLLDILAEELGCEPSEIADFELSVCDTAPGVIGGGAREFIFAGRLDNLAMSYCGLRALLDSTTGEGDTLGEETSVRMCALFDNEEVGSESAQGAGSRVLFAALKRASALLGGGEEGEIDRAICNSFLVSADMAHCLHPNYPERHEDKHQPRMHRGLVVKHNANQRYATTAVTSFLFRELALRRGIPLQDFVVRNDMGCGSTIGPIISSGVGIRTVDVGMPQLSMHSIREMCGTRDVGLACSHFRAFFEDFSDLDARLAVDRAD